MASAGGEVGETRPLAARAEDEEELEYIDGKPVTGARRRLWRGLQSKAFQATSMLCTFYALFAPDICYGFLPASSDTAILSVGLSVVFFFFILEGVATVIARPRSTCELFFYLDVVATLSLIADILWIQEALAGDASEELTLTRSARLARVGARASRLARLARVLRVLKVAKITLLAKTTGTRPEDPTDSDEDASADSLPGSITQLVSDTVTRHVVAIVLVSVIGAAALQFYEEDQAARSAFAVMTRASETSKLHQTQAVVESVPSIYYMSISKFADPLIDKREEQMYQDLRPSETVVYRTGPDDDCVNCVAMVDISVDKVSKAVLSMCLIILIVLVLVVATLSLSRETVQIVLEPTAKLVRVTRNSQALMSVFRAVADADSKHGVDETITTVLDAARKMLSAEVASIYFVDNDGNAKLHQCTWETEPDCRDAKGRLYEVCKGDLSITNAQTDTVVGSVINDAKQSADTEESANERKPFYANLLWVPDMDGVVDMKPRASAKKPRSLKRTVTRTVSQLTRSSTAAAQIDNDWTIRWQTDPSINEISLQMPTSGRKTVRNQLCMTIVAEVAGRRRVVGIVQALNRRVPKKRVRYEGSIQLTDLAFTQDDVKNLEVFCMQIADVIQMKLREVEYEDAKNRSDGVGALLRALELEHVGAATASPRRPPELTGEGSSRSLKKYAEAAIFSNRLSKPKESSLFPIDSLRRWGYSCLDHSVDDLVHCTVQMFEDLGLLHEFQIADANMLRFADKLLASYNEVPYHNAYHAFSVMQGCYVFCTTMKNGQHLQKGQQLALMVSALGHDSGHDGVNNAFHVACESELAILYNDLSPLENVHARRTLGVLKNEDIMVNVEERVKIKSMIVALILSTDMKFHKEKQEGLAKAPIDVKESPDSAEPLMGYVLHGIDIGHPTYSWEEECRWARLVGTEFQAQVNREEALSLPVTGFLRCSGEQNLAEGQLGFLKFFVAGYFNDLQRHIPELKGPTEQIDINLELFKRVAQGTEQMVPASARDNEMMGWSKNVAIAALGNDHDEIKKQQAVTVLMSKRNDDDARP